MKQQCPKCANWVEGKKKEVTNEFLKGFVTETFSAFMCKIYWI